MHNASARPTDGSRGAETDALDGFTDEALWENGSKSEGPNFWLARTELRTVRNPHNTGVAAAHGTSVATTLV